MSERSPRSEGSVIALLTVACVLVVGQMYVVIPLFVPLAAAFTRPPSDLVATSSVFGVAYAFSGLLAGPLADGWGAKKGIVLSLFLTAAATLAVAFARSFSGVILLRGIQGVAAGLFSPPVFAYIARDMDERIRIFATTTVMAAAMSSAILVQLFAQVLEKGAGWRFVFAVPVPMILVAAVLAYGVLRDSDVVAGAGAGVKRIVVNFRLLLRHGRLFALYGAALTLLGGFVAVLSAIALYGPASLHGNPMRLFLLRASALPVMVGVPFMALRLKGSLRLRIVCGLGVAALSLAGASLDAQWVVGLAVALALCVGGILIAAPAIVQGVARTVPEAGGSAVSLYVFSVFLGASLGPRFAVSLAPWGMRGALEATALLLALGGILGGFGARREMR